MSTYALTHASEVALANLAKFGGDDTMLLIKPAHELRATVSVEPQHKQLAASVTVNGTRNTLTLQSADPANPLHLREFIEGIANGTLDTAASGPMQTAQQVSLLKPCRQCNGPAVGFSWLTAADTWAHSARCQYKQCAGVMVLADKAENAATLWNAAQQPAAA